MKFEYLLFIAAIGMAVCGAYFSIIGISTLFGGAMLSTGIMAGIMEFSKLVGVTFLYRYWEKTTKSIKFYMGIASIILILVTSLGIGGFLLSAYQRSSIEFKAGQEKIVMIEGQKPYLNDKIAQSKSRIQTLNEMRRLQESRMNETLTNAFLTRNPLQLKQLQEQTVEMVKTADTDIKREQGSIQSTTEEIQKIDQQVNEMRFASAGKKDIRTFQFVADQFGVPLDTVAKWFIFTIIFVFDPLAIALILAYNVVIYKEEKKEDIITIPQTIIPPVVSLSETPIKKEVITNTIPFVPETIQEEKAKPEVEAPEVPEIAIKEEILSPSRINTEVTSSKNIHSGNSETGHIQHQQPWM